MVTDTALSDVCAKKGMSEMPVNGKLAQRIESVDLLRGVVMVIMALDHVREYFHSEAFVFSPTNLQETYPALFFTRWITHLCAPTFIMLAGTSAYFISQRKSKKETAWFLVSRGLWLIVLQMTLIRFGWNFDPLFRFNSNTIISTIGFCMILMSAIIYLPFKGIVAFSLILIFGHNLLDGIGFENKFADVFWSFLHVEKQYSFENGYAFNLTYPIIPWVGVMAGGYCLGQLFFEETQKRKRILMQLSITGLLLFVVLRFTNIYGDPVPWTSQPSTYGTLMSFFNITKYPPSLLYISATVGLSLLFLALVEEKNLRRWKPVSVFGNVALCYYVLHIYTIHIVAMAAAILTGFSWQDMIYIGVPTKGTPQLVAGGYGFSLAIVYVFWISIVAFLYPLCLYWYEMKKRNKKSWWVSYV